MNTFGIVVCMCPAYICSRHASAMTSSLVRVTIMRQALVTTEGMF